MEHSEVQQLLPAYVDRELGIVDTLAVDRHLETCLACRREIEEQRSAGMRIREKAPYFSAPPALHAQVVTGLPSTRMPRTSPLARRSWWPQTAAALTVALAAALAWGVGEYRMARSPQQILTDELVASHLRSLQVDHLTDLVSSDQHTVKPWFNGKLAFAPPVIDLAAQGYPLIGGRLDYLAGQNVAVLVYRRHRHPINVTIWPGKDLPSRPQMTDRQGYHLVRWSAGGMNFSAVSDLGENELMQFVALLHT